MQCEVTREAVAAASLAPLITAAREEAEAMRRTPPRVVEALAAAGLLQMFLPRSLGGAELPPLAAFHAIEELSKADGSVGWCTMIATVLSQFTGWLDPGVARTMAGTPADFRAAGSLRPQGQAREVDGGYRVSGRWNFASGVTYAQWLYCTCKVMDGDAPRLYAGRCPADPRRLDPHRVGEDRGYMVGGRPAGNRQPRLRHRRRVRGQGIHLVVRRAGVRAGPAIQFSFVLRNAVGDRRGQRTGHRTRGDRRVHRSRGPELDQLAGAVAGSRRGAERRLPKPKPFSVPPAPSCSIRWRRSGMAWATQIRAWPSHEPGWPSPMRSTKRFARSTWCFTPPERMRSTPPTRWSGTSATCMSWSSTTPPSPCITSRPARCCWACGRAMQAGSTAIALNTSARTDDRYRPFPAVRAAPANGVD